MRLKYRIRNAYRRIFTSYLDNQIENLSKQSTEYRHLANYWEQVAKGHEPMPDKDADVQWLADKLYYTALMKYNAQMQVASIENRFRIKDEKVPSDLWRKD